MSSGRFPTGWRDPEYVSTVVGVLAVGALVFYSALVESAPDTGTVLFVLMAVFLSVTVAHEVARRWL